MINSSERSVQTPTTVSPADTTAAQRVSELICTRVELGIRQCSPVDFEGDLFGSLFGLRLKLAQLPFDLAHTPAVFD